MKPKFLVFEGPDAAGKSTIIGSLGSFLGDHVEYATEKVHVGAFQPVSLQLKYLINRAQGLPGIVASLNHGYTVLYDRFAISTWVYWQAFGMPRDVVEAVVFHEEFYIEPDETFLIMPEFNVIMKRMSQKKNLDWIEESGASFHRTVYDLYLEAESKFGLTRVTTVQEVLYHLGLETNDGWSQNHG